MLINEIAALFLLPIIEAVMQVCYFIGTGMALHNNSRNILYIKALINVSTSHVCVNHIIAKSIKVIQWYDFCWLLAGFISHTVRHGLSAFIGLGD